MIEIGVGGHHEVQAAHAECGERGHHHLTAAVAATAEGATGIDQDGMLGGLDQDRVALADIEHHEPGSCGSPLGAGAEAEHGTDRQCAEHARAGPRFAQGPPHDDETRHQAGQARPARCHDGKPGRQPQGAVEEKPSQPGGQFDQRSGARPGREQRGRQGQWKEHHARGGHRHQIGDEPEGGRLPEVDGGQRSRREQRRGRHPREIQPERRKARRLAPPSQHEARRRREGELGTGSKERGGIEQQDETRRQHQGAHRRDGVAADDAERESPEQEGRPLDGNSEPGEQGIARSQTQGGEQAHPATVEPQPGKVRGEPASPPEGQGGDQGEVQAGHGQQVGETQGGDPGAAVRVHCAPLPECERRQEATAGARGQETGPCRGAVALPPRRLATLGGNRMEARVHQAPTRRASLAFRPVGGIG